ncbi:nucleotide disphospho-sugar-binding domain-containing protein [Dactylosporangium sp. CA-233914]|uniref:nucleotide disphospho-sugar-binding domain-containing protein n=1 Tax=Dactylosporangium sp. CA-233914 TaxID=3239934 RepID=UPI003D90DB12
MRVLFTPFNWPTHYYGMATLAWAARAAGHEVRVAAQPSLTEAITQSGMSAVRAGGRQDFVSHAARFMHNQQSSLSELPPERMHELFHLRNARFLATAQDAAEDLIAFTRSWRPDLIVSDPLVHAAPLVAGVLGVPIVHHLFGLDVARKMRLLGLPSPDGDEGFRAFYARYGVELAAEAALRTIDPCPPSIRIPGGADVLPVRCVPYNGPGTVPDWMLKPAERPRVCITWGTSTGVVGGAKSFRIPDLLGPVGKLDVEVVLTLRSSDAALVEDVPDNVRIVHDVPLSILLPTCAAIVYQGGGSTMLTSLYYGVPQVISPQVADQHFNAQAIAGSGAGIHLDAAAVGDFDAVRDAVATAVSDEGIRAAADRLRDEVAAQPTPADIIRTLEHLV